MKAMLVNERRELVWSDVPDPVMKEDEMRIEIHAAALNRADLLQRQGKDGPGDIRKGRRDGRDRRKRKQMEDRR